MVKYKKSSFVSCEELGRVDGMAHCGKAHYSHSWDAQSIRKEMALIACAPSINVHILKNYIGVLSQHLPG